MKSITYLQQPHLLDSLEHHLAEYQHIVFLVDSFIIEHHPHIVKKCTKIGSIFNNDKTIKTDCIVGIGGGRIIDEAKHLAYQHSCDCVLIPTSPATDAPCTDICVVNGHYVKCGFPKKVLVDETLLIHIPLRFLRSGVGDGLSTFFESSHYPMDEQMKHMRDTCFTTLFHHSKQALIDLKNKTLSDALSRCFQAILYQSGVIYAHTGGHLAHELASLFQPHLPHMMHGELVAYFLLIQLIIEQQPQFHDIYSFLREIELPISFEHLHSTLQNEEIISLLTSQSHPSYSTQQVLDAMYTLETYQHKGATS